MCHGQVCWKSEGKKERNLFAPIKEPRVIPLLMHFSEISFLQQLGYYAVYEPMGGLDA